MTKPIDYRETCIVAEPMKYRNRDAIDGGPHPMEGMLLNGRVVYLQEKLQPAAEDREVSAYAEGLGLLLLNSRLLKSLN